MVKRILLTGAQGFIGSHVRDWLRDEPDVELICTGRRLPGAAEGAWVVADLTSPSSALLPIDVDVIVNCASEAQAADAIASPVGHIVRNVQLMTTVLELARRGSAKVIHLSTNEVFDAEGARHEPRSPYGASKAAQEDICLAYRDTYGVDVTIINTRDVFGPRQPATKFIPTVIRCIRAGEPIELHGGLDATRAWLPVQNLAHALGRVAVAPERIPNRRYAVENGPRTNLSVVQDIESLTGLSALLRLVPPERSGHEAVTPPINSQPIGGYDPISFEDCLQEMLRA